MLIPNLDEVFRSHPPWGCTPGGGEGGNKATFVFMPIPPELQPSRFLRHGKNNKPVPE